MWQWRSDTVYYVFFRDPKAERSGKHRRGADGIIRPSPAVFCGLHGLTDATADGIGGTRGLTQAAHRVRLWKVLLHRPAVRLHIYRAKPRTIQAAAELVGEYILL